MGQIAEYQYIYELPNGEAIYNLRDLAVCISHAWGRVTGSETRSAAMSTDPDYFTVFRYQYQDEKVLIETLSGIGDHDKVKEAKITLPTLETLVFDCKSDVLYTYLPGAWEQYLLSKEAQARADLEQIRQNNIRRNQEIEERARRREEARFAPIDDSSLF